MSEIPKPKDGCKDGLGENLGCLLLIAGATMVFTQSWYAFECGLLTTFRILEMNGRKYGHNYAPKNHGFSLRSSVFPISYYAPKRFPRLHEIMWWNLIGRMKRMQCGGTPDELWSTTTGLNRKINWGKTMGWWTK